MDLKISIDKTGLLGLVHDNYFLLSELEWDRERREVHLYLSDRRKGPFDKRLSISDVTDLTIRDKERIERYTLVDLRAAGDVIHVLSEPNCELLVTTSADRKISLMHGLSREKREERRGRLR